MKILIVEDESSLAEDILKYLGSEAHICEWASNFEDASEKIELYDYDCIVLDLMLPGGTGLDLLRQIKAAGKEDGIIIISAKNSIEDKIEGLRLGSDDYLSKPFHLAELSARIESVIRRKQYKSQPNYSWNELNIDLNARRVQVHDNELHLTSKEYSLLLFFIGNANRVLSKNALAEHLSGDLADMFDNHDFIYAHVKNLKKKLKEAKCENYIHTVYGTGYIWKQ